MNVTTLTVNIELMSHLWLLCLCVCYSTMYQAYNFILPNHIKYTQTTSKRRHIFNLQVQRKHTFLVLHSRCAARPSHPPPAPHHLENTGCSITPCSAISQASCRSPDDRRGAALLQEDVGDMLVWTIHKKSPAKAAMAIIAAKRQEVAANRYAIFSGRRFCDAVWRRRRVLFFK